MDKPSGSWPLIAIVVCLFLGAIFVFTLNRVNQPVNQVVSNPTVTSTQELWSTVQSVSSTFETSTITLIQRCNGTVKQTEAGLEASSLRNFCVGTNVLWMKLPSGPEYKLQTVDTTSELDAPSLWSAKLLDNSRLLISYFVKDYGDLGPEYKAFGPFATPPNLIVDVDTRGVRVLKNFPFESQPIWNRSHTKAVFAPGGDGMSGGPYPLIGYDVTKDERYTLTKETAGGPCCVQTLVAYPHWENVKWIDDQSVEATHVSITGKKTIRVTVPPSVTSGAPIDWERVKNLTFPLVGFNPSQRVSLRNGTGRFFAGSVADYGQADLEDVHALSDLNGDGREDAIVSLRVNTGGTGRWANIYIILNTESGLQVIHSAEASLGDRDIVQSIVTRPDGTIQFDLIVHTETDPACCPSRPETRLFRYENQKLVRVQ